MAAGRRPIGGIGGARPHTDDARPLKVVEVVAKVEPTVATITGMFVPGAAPVVAMVQPFVLMAIPYVERALNDVAAGNGGDFMGAMIEIMQHLSKGQPNSPTLT